MALAETIMTTAGDSKEILGPIVLAASIAGTLFKSVTMVGPRERGIRTKFGIPRTDKDGVYVTAEPGPRVTYPFTHGIELVSVADRSVELDHVTFDRTSQYIARATVIWGISEDREALVNSQINPVEGELGEIVKGVCQRSMFYALHTVNERLFTGNDSAHFSHFLKQSMNYDVGPQLMDRYGVEIRDVNAHIARTDGEKGVEAARVVADAINHGAHILQPSTT